MDIKAVCEGIGRSDNLPISVGADFLEICKIPKMSTPALGALINLIVMHMPENQRYVNVGVWYGFSLFAGMLGNHRKICIGVDNFSQLGAPRNQFQENFLKYGSNNHAFFNMSFQNYFRQYHDGPIGFYFYDGDHSYQSQLDGLKMAEPHFAEDCLIMVDDTNQEFPRQATLDFIAQSKNHYEILFDKMTEIPKDEKWWNGIMMLQKKNVSRETHEITEEEAEG
jgi:hypothetical protein